MNTVTCKSTGMTYEYNHNEMYTAFWYGGQVIDMVQNAIAPAVVNRLATRDYTAFAETYAHTRYGLHYPFVFATEIMPQDADCPR